MGSCFARNIELRLKYMGVPLSRFEFSMTHAEWPGDVHDIVNKFTPASIYEEIKWCHNIYVRGNGFQPSDPDELFYDVGDGMVVDAQLAGMLPILRERAVERRRALYEYFSKVFEAEGVILTLGLIECWWDADRNRFLEQVPYNRTIQRQNGQNIYFYQLSYDEARDFIAESIRLINSVNGTKKILLTTSPVPLARTFTQDDVIIANTYSKSMLRTVCGELASKYEDVAYVPSYETVSLTRDWFVYDSDKRHVSQRIVSQIIARAISGFFTNVSETGMDFVNSVALFEEGDIDGALALARKVVSDDPHQLDYLRHLASCFEKKGLFIEALEVRKQLFDAEPGDELAATAYIRACVLGGDLDAAAEVGEAYRDRYGAGRYIRPVLATLYLRIKDFEKSKELALEAVEANKLDYHSYNMLSIIYESQGDLPESLKCAEEACRLKWDSEEYKERVSELQTRLQEMHGN